MRLFPELPDVRDDQSHYEVDQHQAAHDGQAHHEEHGEQPGVVVVSVGVVEVVEVELSQDLTLTFLILRNERLREKQYHGERLGHGLPGVLEVLRLLLVVHDEEAEREAHDQDQEVAEAQRQVAHDRVEHQADAAAQERVSEVEAQQR